MHNRQNTGFVNREAELSLLDSCLTPGPAANKVVVLKAPPGFGKSGLTDRFRSMAETHGRPFCVVDPLVLHAEAGTRLHDGYFIQRCAEALDRKTSECAVGWGSFEAHERTRRWKNARETTTTDLVEAFLADETVRRPVFNYLTRLLGMGKYSPSEMLESDAQVAVSRCTDYALSVLANHRCVLIVREAHLLDIYSLRTLLEVVASEGRSQLIFEYTSERGFAPAHEKLLLRYPFVRLCPIPKMGREHVEALLRAAAHDEVLLTDDAHEAWDGNLRALEWLSRAVPVSSGLIPLRLAPRLVTSLAGHLSGLPTPHKLALGIIHANAEPIARDVLLDVLALYGDAAIQGPEQVLDGILAVPGLVLEVGLNLRLDNETIAQAIAESPHMARFVALAEKGLRDTYRTIMVAYGPESGEFRNALRHLFRLSARTRDVTGLIEACRILDERTALSSDQTLYVDAVSTALQVDAPLYKGDFDKLLIWAASLAYETNDPRRSADLLERLQTQDAFTLAMRAFALQEFGRHEAALSLAEVIASDAGTSDELLVARLIEAMVSGCRGEGDRARVILESLLKDPAFQESPLLGYAYRFHEVIDGYIECLPKLMLSAEWFARFGLETPRAHSELPAAIYLARLGRMEEARSLLASAVATLEGTVFDKHLVLNNTAVLELLAEKPDYPSCVALLSEALRFARDDFSEMTILTNLALARMGAGDLVSASASARQTMAILQDHDFADRDIYWPICFNAAKVFEAAGEIETRDATLRFPREAGGRVSVNSSYWAYRYGELTTPPPGFEYLAARPRHPVYLSHWLMEVEALRKLRREPLQ